MSFFVRENRYLALGNQADDPRAELDKTLHEGSLTTCIAPLEATLNEIHASIAIQNEGFENVIHGSRVTMEEVLRKAPLELVHRSQRGGGAGADRNRVVKIGYA